MAIVYPPCIANICVSSSINRGEEFHENDNMELHSKSQIIFQLNEIIPTIPTTPLNRRTDLEMCYVFTF